MTLAERLQTALTALKLSQTEAAGLCGISQQSINYILKKNLDSSKLAPQIAAGLGVNPEWLIFGQGKLKNTTVYKLPILSSPVQLHKFISGSLELDLLASISIDTYLGASAFAYQYEMKELVICCDPNNHEYDFSEYLVLTGNTVNFDKNRSSDSFPIYEWRRSCHDY